MGHVLALQHKTPGWCPTELKMKGDSLAQDPGTTVWQRRPGMEMEPNPGEEPDLEEGVVTQLREGAWHTWASIGVFVGWLT